MIRMRSILILLLCFSLVSCAPVAFVAGTAAGVGGYKYYEGALTVIYQASYQKTWDASLKALEEMSIRITSKQLDITSGGIMAIEASGRTMKIFLKYISPQETEVTIRVGLFGDEDASKIIKDKIASILF